MHHWPELSTGFLKSSNKAAAKSKIHPCVGHETEFNPKVKVATRDFNVDIYNSLYVSLVFKCIRVMLFAVEIKGLSD